MALQFRAEPIQPALPIRVLQGDALTHLADVFRRMKLVAFNECQPQVVGQQPAHGGLAATRDAHHNDPHHLTLGVA